ELGRTEAKCLARDFFRNAVDLEHDTTRLDLASPVFNRTLTLTHTNFGGLCSNRDVREDADPYSTRALHVTRNRAASRFDFAGVHAVRFLSLQAEFAECQIKTALGHTLDAT